jgi:hypothetical protein
MSGRAMSEAAWLSALRSIRAQRPDDRQVGNLTTMLADLIALSADDDAVAAYLDRRTAEAFVAADEPKPEPRRRWWQTRHVVDSHTRTN